MKHFKIPKKIDQWGKRFTCYNCRLKGCCEHNELGNFACKYHDGEWVGEKWSCCDSTIYTGSSSGCKRMDHQENRYGDRWYVVNYFEYKLLFGMGSGCIGRTTKINPASLVTLKKIGPTEQYFVVKRYEGDDDDTIKKFARYYFDKLAKIKSYK